MPTWSKRRIRISTFAVPMVAIALVGAGVTLRRPAHVAEAPRSPAPASVQQQGAPRPDVPERTAPEWLEARPLDQLLKLARCIERSRGDSVGRTYPRSLAAVERLVCAASSGYDDHHFVYYTPPRGKSDPWRARGFTLEVEAVWDSTDEPVKRDIPATRSYLIDTAGRIHVTSDRRRATASDPALPMCESGSAGATDCQPFLPRQRWGVRPQIPVAYLSASRDTIRKGRPLEVSIEFDPFSPIDRLGSYSITWSEGARPSTQHLTDQKGWPTRGLTAVGFREKHVYSDTGQKVITVVLRTTGGERYNAYDTVVVRPR